MQDWKDLNKALHAAIDRGDLGEAERLLEALWADARRREDPNAACDTHFTEGVLRDAQRRFDDAEAAFSAALALDRRLRGPRHASTAETLYSIAIVCARRGDRERAIAAYTEAADIFRATRPYRVPRCLHRIGAQLLALDRTDDALDRFVAAERAAAANRLTPLHDHAAALHGVGEALRLSGRYPEAFGALVRVTRVASRTMWPELADTVARAWYGLGLVSRHLKGAQAQAAFAFWYATVHATAELRREAEAKLATLPDRELAGGDPAQFRVVYRDEGGNIHVASAVRGLYHVRTDMELALGDIVDVALRGHAVQAIRMSPHNLH